MVDLKDVSKLVGPGSEVETAVDAQRRADNCLVDIKNALQRWGCTIDPMIQISGQGISRSYGVIPLVKRVIS